MITNVGVSRWGDIGWSSTVGGDVVV